MTNSDDPGLEGRVAVVTGAAGGIGRVLVRGLLDSGARVAAFDVDEVGLGRLAAGLRDAGHDGDFIVGTVDISEFHECEAGVKRARDMLGDIGILINNGAMGMGAIRMDHMTELVGIREVDPDVWSRFVATNLSGGWYMTKACIEPMLARGWGRIVNVTTSFFTMLRGGFHPYGPAKAGFEAMSAGHAKEFAGSGVTVNVVVPGGPADTPMVPHESGFDRVSLIPPEAMTAPILWLCSDAAAGNTGERYVAAEWDGSLAPEEAAKRCRAPIGWPELAGSPVWPGGTPDC